MKMKENARDKCINFESFSGMKIQHGTIDNLGVTKIKGVKCSS